jgi:two-component system NtrC family sensor kinase
MSNQTNHRILVIDDNRAIHDDFRKILCPANDAIGEEEAEFFGTAASVSAQPSFDLNSAFQGEEGVAMLRRALDEGRPYAMAFVDVRMPPGLDGIETAERLWQLCPELQVVICTAHSDYSWQEMITRLGHRDRLLILKKPFATVEALQLACALCEKWKLTQEARDRLADTERIVAERTRELRAANEQLQAEMEQRKQAEAHLLRAQRLESIGTLASGIAHDLNNMLAPILMSADLLRASPPEECEELISLIESSAGRAASVVKQVLTFARGIEGERLPMVPKELVREMEKIVGETFPRLIHLESRIPDDLSLIEGDATQLHQVLLNLCVNARDAMPDGGVLRIEADDFEVDAPYASMTPGARVGRYVRLRVSDSGGGIPRHLIDKIFDPFFTTKPLGKGTGLGLSTVIGIVRSHEGFLDVQSEIGEGTTFEVFLPAVLDGAPFVAREEEAASPAGHGELILVVDDESAVRTVTQSVLTENGYRTLTAADGAEAISIFASQIDRIDAVVTDVMMPLVDGVALCRALKKMNPAVRIVAATGSGEESRLQELRSLNIGRVLGKPFSIDTLLTALAEALLPHPASLS